jgi:hypothetical protein
MTMLRDTPHRIFMNGPSFDGPGHVRQMNAGAASYTLWLEQIRIERNQVPPPFIIGGLA